ncbi:hypothetical protein KRP22_011101 [Phytophthora ramorum]|uniref:uncharacterized protein n=1 Tax=Phytophthora ramorum TaxID=164328 RepID=UPI00309C3256|nr:hypothetical protein KRP23_5111 [Phytophthora ramorum]KAH7504534.1 hypothetical protein KRP22_5024 [Phytophthora ramorum]
MVDWELDGTVDGWDCGDSDAVRDEAGEVDVGVIGVSCSFTMPLESKHDSHGSTGASTKLLSESTCIVAASMMSGWRTTGPERSCKNDVAPEELGGVILRRLS